MKAVMGTSNRHQDLPCEVTIRVDIWPVTVGPVLGKSSPLELHTSLFNLINKKYMEYKETEYDVPTKESLIDGHLTLYVAGAISKEILIDQIKKLALDERIDWHNKN